MGFLSHVSLGVRMLSIAERCCWVPDVEQRPEGGQLAGGAGWTNQALRLRELQHDTSFVPRNSGGQFGRACV